VVKWRRSPDQAAQTRTERCQNSCFSTAILLGFLFSLRTDQHYSFLGPISRDTYGRFYRLRGSRRFCAEMEVFRRTLLWVQDQSTGKFAYYELPMMMLFLIRLAYSMANDSLVMEYRLQLVYLFCEFHRHIFLWWSQWTSYSTFWIHLS